MCSYFCNQALNREVLLRSVEFKFVRGQYVVVLMETRTVTGQLLSNVNRRGSVRRQGRHHEAVRQQGIHLSFKSRPGISISRLRLHLLVFLLQTTTNTFITPQLPQLNRQKARVNHQSFYLRPWSACYFPVSRAPRRSTPSLSNPFLLLQNETRQQFAQRAVSITSRSHTVLTSSPLDKNANY